MTICILAMLPKVHIPAIGEAGLAFFLFPLNACLNPVINTLSTGNYLEESTLKDLMKHCFLVTSSKFVNLVNYYKCYNFNLERILRNCQRAKRLLHDV